MAPEAKTEVIQASAGAIENSRWKSRVTIMVLSLIALFVLFAIAVFTKADRSVIGTLERLLALVLVLAVVTPSGEQIIKMLAQVTAIRFGVGKSKESAS